MTIDMNDSGIVLILASVPLFRALWMMMDGIAWLNGKPRLYSSFAAGLALASLAISRINKA